MEFEFEDFTSRATPPAREPMATIQKGGKAISLNRAAFEALGSPTHVTYAWDQKRRAIGLKPATSAVAHGYAVKKQPQSESYLVSAKAFLATYDIPTEIGRRYRCEPYGEILVIRVDDPVLEVTGPKMAAKSRFAGNASRPLPGLDG